MTVVTAIYVVAVRVLAVQYPSAGVGRVQNRAHDHGAVEKFHAAEIVVAFSGFHLAWIALVVANGNALVLNVQKCPFIAAVKVTAFTAAVKGTVAPVTHALYSSSS